MRFRGYEKYERNQLDNFAATVACTVRDSSIVHFVIDSSIVHLEKYSSWYLLRFYDSDIKAIKIELI